MVQKLFLDAKTMAQDIRTTGRVALYGIYFDFDKAEVKRAEDVVKVLTTQFRVGAWRLKSYGVCPVAPVTSNKTEEGRAKNRRVELVEQ
jgi:outer membrane protein OmpA-like peptidoglycan-associated protein